MAKILKTVEHKNMIRERELQEDDNEEEVEERDLQKDKFFGGGEDDEHEKKIVLRDGQVKKDFGKKGKPNPKFDRSNNYNKKPNNFDRPQHQ